MDLTRSTLDGTAAPQGSGEVHCDTPTRLPASAPDSGDSTSARYGGGDTATSPPAPEVPEMSLIELLQATGQGSEQAFTNFYQRTSHRAFGLVRRVVLDTSLAEEVVQEVFIAVWRDAATYDPAKGSPTTWLLTIAHRKAVDKVRSHQSSNSRYARWAAASWTRPYDEITTSILDRMEKLQLVDSLAALSPVQREAIVLAYFGSLTYREVAERLSKPLPTIKSRIRDGLNQLREQLEPT
ncbi:ECF RNA polymerase sigma factor SigK [Paenarthrobacter nicotinovorans]|uniref:ECF RNA polymerase sigma factor SigK n=1 Tax=Paenarthrobacter nicotinovorans TaxID=29320 RepID=UPI0038131B42